jgi:hypothetical protein
MRLDLTAATAQPRNDTTAQMAEYIKAEERLFAMFPGIDLRLAALAPAGARIEADPAPHGLGERLGRIAGRVSDAITALTHGVVRFGAGGAAATSREREADAVLMAAKLRELREKLPSAEDRATLLADYGAWLDGLREQLVIQHGEAQARLVGLREELEEAAGDAKQGRAALAALDEQQRELERSRLQALATFDEVQVRVSGS